MIWQSSGLSLIDRIVRQDPTLEAVSLLATLRADVKQFEQEMGELIDAIEVSPFLQTMLLQVDIEDDAPFSSELASIFVGLMARLVRHGGLRRCEVYATLGFSVALSSSRDKFCWMDRSDSDSLFESIAASSKMKKIRFNTPFIVHFESLDAIQNVELDELDIGSFAVPRELIDATNVQNGDSDNEDKYIGSVAVAEAVAQLIRQNSNVRQLSLKVLLFENLRDLSSAGYHEPIAASGTTDEERAALNVLADAMTLNSTLERVGLTPLLPASAYLRQRTPCFAELQRFYRLEAANNLSVRADIARQTFDIVWPFMSRSGVATLPPYVLLLLTDFAIDFDEDDSRIDVMLEPSIESASDISAATFWQTVRDAPKMHRLRMKVIEGLRASVRKLNDNKK